MIAATVALAMALMQVAPVAALSLDRASSTGLTAPLAVYAAELGLSVDQAVRMRVFCGQIARVLDPGGAAGGLTADLDCPFCRLLDAPGLAGRSADAWIGVVWPADRPHRDDRTWAALDPPPLGFVPRAPPAA